MTIFRTNDLLRGLWRDIFLKIQQRVEYAILG